MLASPSAGKRLRLLWIALSTSQDNSFEVLAKVKLGAQVVYSWYLGTPGAFTHRELVVAPNVDDQLVLNLSTGGQSVAANWTTTEV